MPVYQTTFNSKENPQNKPVYDFRSDTTTVATPEMMKAMISCPTGDDVKDEDPTVNQLQIEMAKLFGQEDALFVVSGCLGNQLCIKSHLTEQQSKKQVVIQQVICDMRAHVFAWEYGGVSQNSSSQIIPIQIPDDQYLTAEKIEQYLFLDHNMHTPITTVISLESPLNGQIIPLDEIKKIRKVCDKYDLRLHLDGARVWNLAISLDIPLREYTKYFDSISACFSKGLGCPIGSIICSSKSIISKAKQYRKMLGAGWRQAGHLANAAIYAVENNWKNMKNDHQNALVLTNGLKKLGFKVLFDNPQTNIVIADSSPLNVQFTDLENYIHKMNSTEKEIIKIETDKNSCRFVTHLQTPPNSIEALLSRLQSFLKKSKL